MNITIRTRSDSVPGFTLFELVVVLAVLVALSAVLVPAVGTVVEDNRISKVTQLYDTLKRAASKYYLDTGEYPHEYAGDSYLSANHHQLSMPQSLDGWSGPYLEEPVTLGDNPWNGNVHLYSYLLVNGMNGWDLDRDGDYETTAQESACVLWYSGVPHEAAVTIDEQIDLGTNQRDVDWTTAGRVQYKSGSLWLLVYRNTEQ